jgi:hypothetical protein
MQMNVKQESRLLIRLFNIVTIIQLQLDDEGVIEQKKNHLTFSLKQ